MALLAAAYPFAGLASPDSLGWSWVLSDILAAMHHVRFGSQYIWTYGPLGFLDAAVAYSRPLLALSDAAQVVLALSLAIAFVYFCHHMLRLSLSVAALVSIALFAQGAVAVSAVEYSALLVALLLLAVRERNGGTWVPPLAGALLAVSCLTKASVLPLVAVIAVGWSITRFVVRQRRDVAGFVAGFFVAWIVAFLAFGGGIAAALRWPLAVVPLISGYTSMTIIGPLLPVLIGAVALLAAAALTIWRLFQRRAELPPVWLLIAADAFLFSVFKEGVVREDGHVFIFLAMLGWCAIVFIAWGSLLPRGSKVRRAVAAAGAAALLVSGVAAIAHGQTVLVNAAQLHSRLSAYRAAVRFVASRAVSATSLKAQAAAAMKLNPGLAALAPMIAGKTAFAWPWNDNAIIAAGGVEATPPVPQEYSAYTPSLDRADASFLRSPSRPQIAVVTVEAIDERLPLQTAPETLRALLACYRPVRQSGAFILAASRPCVASPAPFSWSPWRVVPFEATVSVPSVPGRVTLAQIQVTPNLLGDATSFAFRLAPLYLGLDGHLYRLPGRTATDGIIVSPPPTSAAALLDLWRGQPVGVVHALRLSSPSAWQWGGTVRIRFAEAVPALL